eukprot:1176367-Prorocentrum_minimum.AAC.2
MDSVTKRVSFGCRKYVERGDSRNRTETNAYLLLNSFWNSRAFDISVSENSLSFVLFHGDKGGSCCKYQCKHDSASGYYSNPKKSAAP